MATQKKIMQSASLEKKRIAIKYAPDERSCMCVPFGLVTFARKL